MRGPSDKALAGAWAMSGVSESQRHIIEDAVKAAYPIIIAEVVEALREKGRERKSLSSRAWYEGIANFIEREFGGER